MGDSSRRPRTASSSIENTPFDRSDGIDRYDGSTPRQTVSRRYIECQVNATDPCGSAGSPVVAVHPLDGAVGVEVDVPAAEITVDDDRDVDGVRCRGVFGRGDAQPRG